MSNHINKCVLGMRHLSADTFIVEAKMRQKALDNPVFSGIVPSPATVSAVIERLVEANNECSKRNFSFLPLRNHLIEELLGLIGLQCVAVNNIAQGDLDILMLSSFPLKKAYSFRPLPSQGVLLSIKADCGTGEISVQAQADKEKRYYIFEVHQADGVVISHLSQKAKTVIAGVAPNMEIAVRVCAGNSRGNGPWSQYLKFATPRLASSQAINDDNIMRKIA